MNDIESRISRLREGSQQSDVKELESIKNCLGEFSNSLKELFKYLKGLNNEDMRNKEIKRLAALMVAPDCRSLNIRDILWRKITG
ncbi:conserved hypothetical protein [Desulfurococcaceae archaeon AG1]|nr:conserved hypothetical protein [Desulfurococcaceae archaeon AG1]